ncbi:MAG: RNA-guided endonuclease InsQ/TnpB family protein [Candidatus Heimdallarchaeaceae archaeon]|jgi:putative transposase
MAQVVWRTEIMETKTHPALQQLCHHTKNLYNRAMFLFKQHYLQTKKWLSYQQLDRTLKKEQCYKILPVHTAQHTLILLTRNWKNYKQALIEFKIAPHAFLGKPRPPRYKVKNGQQIAIFTNQQSKIKGRKLLLPKKVPFTLKTRLTEADKLKEVRIIPRGTGYTIEIVYSKLVPDVEVNGKIGAIDLGIKNLLTYVDNIGSRSIVVKDEGKGIKSIIQFYLKEVKKLQEQYAQQQRRNLKQNRNRLKYGLQFHQLRETKRRKVKNWIHQMSSFFVNLWKEQGITKVFIGYNPRWKQQVRLRKKTTQMFVIIPFEKIIHSLTYKAEEKGIIVEMIDESFTSKCSFLDNESPKKRKKYKGTRVNRGQFKSAIGVLINADVNAAYNILCKGDPQAIPKRNVGGVGGYVIYPLRLRFEQ